MLSNEQLLLLQWIESQPSAPTMNDMERLHAPCFSQQRVEQMYQAGLLCRELNRVSLGGGLCASYSVSDMGRIELDAIAKQNATEHKEVIKERKEDMRHIINTVIAVLALLLSVISILLQQS